MQARGTDRDGELLDFFKRTFGPVAAIYASLEGDPDRSAELDRAFSQFAESCNSGPSGGPAEYRYEYLLVIGDRAHAEGEAR